MVACITAAAEEEEEEEPTPADSKWMPSSVSRVHFSRCKVKPQTRGGATLERQVVAERTRRTRLDVREGGSMQAHVFFLLFFLCF